LAGDFKRHCVESLFLIRKKAYNTFLNADVDMIVTLVQIDQFLLCTEKLFLLYII